MNLSKEPDDRLDREFLDESLDKILGNLGMSADEIQRAKHKARKDRKLRRKRMKRRFRDRK